VYRYSRPGAVGAVTFVQTTSAQSNVTIVVKTLKSCMMEDVDKVVADDVVGSACTHSDAFRRSHLLCTLCKDCRMKISATHVYRPSVSFDSSEG
jgi:hypothetical protein